MNDKQKRSIRDRFMAKTERRGKCLIWTGRLNKPDGYGQFDIDGSAQQAHRVAWMLFKGPIPDGIKVLHTCDTPLCVEVDHLFLGTLSDNTQDMLAKGRNKPTIGQTNGRAKLTVEQVDQIRAMKGQSAYRKIADMFKISPSQVGRIINGTRWRTT